MKKELFEVEENGKKRLVNAEQLAEISKNKKAEAPKVAPKVEENVEVKEAPKATPKRKR